MAVYPIPGSEVNWLGFADQVLNYAGYHAIAAASNPTAIARVEMAISNSPDDLAGLLRLQFLWHEVISGQVISQTVVNDFNWMASDCGLPISFDSQCQVVINEGAI